jgi:twitching motility protein PilT
MPVRHPSTSSRGPREPDVPDDASCPQNPAGASPAAVEDAAPVRSSTPQPSTSILEILRYAAQLEASDVHVSVGMRPRFRLDSRLTDSIFDIVGRDAMEGFIRELIPADRVEQFRKERELDFSIGHQDVGRFRVNAFFQRTTIGMAIRIFPTRLKTLEEIGLPEPLITQFAGAVSGLLLITGGTGTGKTTTLAAIVNLIARTRDCHIVTIEDPIEFVYRNQLATIHQREVGSDTLSFCRALKQVLRQDPDVIVVGEMRDLETIEAALTAAETGHLVIATLHTSDATQTVNRIIDVFPENKQNQVRSQLSFVLNAIISQRLVRRANGRGRVLASEILIANQAVSSLIREAKTHQIFSTIQTHSREGMKSFNQSLQGLVATRTITMGDALLSSSNPDELRRSLGVPISLPTDR